VSTKIVLTGSVFEADEGLGETSAARVLTLRLVEDPYRADLSVLVRSTRRAAREIRDPQSLRALRRTALHALFDVDLGKGRHRGRQDAGLRARQHSRQSACARLCGFRRADANCRLRKTRTFRIRGIAGSVCVTLRARDGVPDAACHAGSISRRRPIFRNRSRGSMRIVRIRWRLVGTSRRHGTSLQPTTKTFSDLSRRNRTVRAWSGSNVS
jgi:hypothetical protein